MSKFIDPSAVEQLQKALEPWKSTMDQIASKMAMICERQAAMLDEFSRVFADGIRSAEQVLEKAEVLGKFGWALPMHATPGELVWLIERSIDLESANQAFHEYYTVDGGSQYRGLMKELVATKPWKYGESIFRKSSKPTTRGSTECAFQRYSPRLKASGTTGRQDSTSLMDDGSFSNVRWRDRRPDPFDGPIWRSTKTFVETVFETVTPANTKPLVVNRNLILHGRGIPDGTQTDCLRLLQAIHTFAFLAGASLE